MKKLSKIRVLQVLEENGGKFFSCKFRKQDKTIREMSCRTGVKRHLRGGKNKVQKNSNGLLTVWDRVAEDYRCINIETMTELCVQGTRYVVV